MTEQLSVEFGAVVDSIEFKTLVESFDKIFPVSKDFSEWVYSNGATLQGYIMAGSDHEIMADVTGSIKAILKGNGLTKVYKQLEKNEDASNFFVKWLRSQGVTKDDLKSFGKASKRTRNIFSYFLVMLLNFTTVNNGVEASPEVA